MAFDTTARVSLTLDQLLDLVDQLSDKDVEKVAARLALKRKKDAVARMAATMSKVRLTPREVDKIVEEVRQERYEKRKARAAGR
ncbi:MAG: hypothetical protein M3R08_00595 [Bacteroidota bacterium]|nr:hypothetical protein [Bacteroidota bacterium]